MSSLGSRSITDLWPDLVDRRTGVIREVSELRIDDDEPPFVHFLAYSCDTEAFGFLTNFGNNGGVGTSAHSAIAKALGEGVERYCSAFFRYDELHWSSYAELDRPATPPASFALYSDQQYAAPGFPWRRFDDDAPVAWVRGDLAGHRGPGAGAGGLRLRAVPLRRRPAGHADHPAHLHRAGLRPRVGGRRAVRPVRGDRAGRLHPDLAGTALGAPDRPRLAPGRCP